MDGLRGCPRGAWGAQLRLGLRRAQCLHSLGGGTTGAHVPSRPTRVPDTTELGWLKAGIPRLDHSARGPVRVAYDRLTRYKGTFLPFIYLFRRFFSR